MEDIIGLKSKDDDGEWVTAGNEDCYEPTNREKSQVAKRGLFWCDRCDGQLVGQWGKCKNCGYKNKKKKKG